MKRTPITLDPTAVPAIFHPYLAGAQVWDSSCSPEARVYYLEKDGGYFLKSAPSGTLAREAAMTRFFHEKGMAAQVVAEASDERDWLLTTRVLGEDCTHAQYLADPKRLCDTTAALLRSLHEMPTDGCPIPDRTSEYLATVERNHALGIWDASLFPDNWGFASAEEAVCCVRAHKDAFQTDVLLHGDYCLPNVMLDDWRFSGFIDVGNGGVGDRHIDLFWGIWTLRFNLGTDAYAERFLDAYGREKVEPEMLRVVAAAEVFG